MTPIQKLVRQVSYSSFGELRTCERKYELDKAAPRGFGTSIDLCFGKAVGAGCQELWLSSGKLEKAEMAVFEAWDCPFGEEKTTVKKSIAHAIQAVRLYFPFYQILSRDWELAFVNGKPGVEFSLKIEFPGGFIYRAYADLLLRHKQLKEIAVHEFKTTGANIQHEAAYKNSDQGTSYSLIVDQLEPGASHFWVNYFAFYSKTFEWVPFPFPKTLVHKAKWLRTALMDIRHIKECEDANYFPMRGQSCIQFGRQCRYFDVCQLPNEALFATEGELTKRVEEEEKREFSFVVPLETIVERYLK